MSVLIKGMEMPKDCIDCFAETYNVCMVTGRLVNSLGRPDWCPLVEVPKHGRLIEADEAIGKIVHGEYVTMVDKYGNSWMMPGKAIEIIADAPTIIEAEGRENE